MLGVLCSIAFPVLATEDLYSGCLTGLRPWENGQKINPKPDAKKIASTMQQCEALLPDKSNDKTIERQLCLGYYLLARGSEAIPHCINGRAEKPSLAETVLGAVYLSGIGKGSEPYQERALYWLRQAADSGEAWPMRLLGNALAKADSEEAAWWLQRAADKGDVEALVDLLDEYPPQDRADLLAQALNKVFALPPEAMGYIDSKAIYILGQAFNDSPETFAMLYDTHITDLQAMGDRHREPIAELLGWRAAFRFADIHDHQTALERLRRMLPTVNALDADMIRGFPNIQQIEKNMWDKPDFEILSQYGEVLLEVYNLDSVRFNKATEELCNVLANNAKRHRSSVPVQCEAT